MMIRMAIMEEEEEITCCKKTEKQKNIKTLIMPQNIVRKKLKAQ